MIETRELPSERRRTDFGGRMGVGRRWSTSGDGSPTRRERRGRGKKERKRKKKGSHGLTLLTSRANLSGVTESHQLLWRDWWTHGWMFVYLIIILFLFRNYI
jgi:hypothetical protein